MKKKIISLALASVMCFGTVFALTACEEEKQPINQDPPARQETLYTQLTDSMTEAISSMRAMELSFDVFMKTIRDGLEVTDNDYNVMGMTGNAALSLKDLRELKADVYLFEKGIVAGEAIPTGSYQVVYMRGNTGYWAEGEAIGYSNCDAIKAGISDGSIKLESDSMAPMPEETTSGMNGILEAYQGLLQTAPILTEGDEATFELFGGAIEETETGYVMTLSAPKMLDAVVALIGEALKWVEANVQTTISELLKDEETHASLAAALEGYTAAKFFVSIRQALYQVADKIEEIATSVGGESASLDLRLQIDEIYAAFGNVLPEPQENETMLAYVERCIASEELFETIRPIISVTDSNIKCLGDLSIAAILQMQGVATSDLVTYAEMLKDWKTLLISSVMGGVAAEGVVDLTLSYHFDKAKKLTGISVNAKLIAVDQANAKNETSLLLSMNVAFKDDIELYEIGK